MTETQLPIYDKIKKLLEDEGFIISSEQGFPDVSMYLTAWDENNTRVQLNVNKNMIMPQRLKKKFYNITPKTAEECLKIRCVECSLKIKNEGCQIEFYKD